MVASAGLPSCAGACATLPNPSTSAGHRLVGRNVIWALSPFLIAPCGDGSSAIRTTSVSEVASSDRGTGPGVFAELAEHVGDPHRLGQEDHVAESERSGRGQSRCPGALERFDRVGDAERAQIAIELANVLALLAPVQRAVGRDRAAQQHHGLVVHPVEHVATADLFAVLRQLRVHAAGLVDHRVRRAVRACPVGQGPGLGDHRREVPPLHLRRCSPACPAAWRAPDRRRTSRPRRRRRLRRPGLPPRPVPRTFASPPARGRFPEIATLRYRGVENGHAPGPVGRRDLVGVDAGSPLTGSGKSFTPFSRMQSAN